MRLINKIELDTKEKETLQDAISILNNIIDESGDCRGDLIVERDVMEFVIDLKDLSICVESQCIPEN